MSAALKYEIKLLDTLDKELRVPSFHIKPLRHLIYILFNFQAWSKESNELVDRFSELSALNLSDSVILECMLSMANMLH